jgi:hypothetical protein
MNDRGIPSLLAIYFGVIGTLVAGAGLGLTKIVDASAGMAHHSEREKSLLDERLATARSIKQVLAKPVPRPEPLAPITAKPEHAASKVAATPKPARPKLSAEARDAMASADVSAQSQLRSGPADYYDRHAVVSQ